MIITTAAHIALGILLIAFSLTLIRLLKGPSRPDRIVALELIASLTMGIIITFTLISGEPIYLDIVLVITLVVFLGTVTVAKYLKKEKV